MDSLGKVILFFVADGYNRGRKKEFLSFYAVLVKTRDEFFYGLPPVYYDIYYDLLNEIFRLYLYVECERFFRDSSLFELTKPYVAVLKL